MAYRRRNSLRLKGYEYGVAGFYFVTITTKDSLPLFGEVAHGQMIPNSIGTIVIDHWNRIPSHYTHVHLDVFQLMPNHLHGIIALTNCVKTDDSASNTHDVPTRQQYSARHLISGSLSAIVGSFKSGVTRDVNRDRPLDDKIPIWHRNYYDVIVRCNDDLARVREYIRHNPKKI
jgi:putative transposase